MGFPLQNLNRQRVDEKRIKRNEKWHLFAIEYLRVSDISSITMDQIIHNCSRYADLMLEEMKKRDL